MIIFVFGSNLAGIHGAGAAYDALCYWGATWGQGQGLSGDSWAIATKDYNVRTSLPLERIGKQVARFILFAEECNDWDFQTTAIGCGYAGYTKEQIAPLFKGAPPNIHLPIGWRDLLTRG